MQTFEDWRKGKMIDAIGEAYEAWYARDAEIETKQRECDILKSSIESYIKLVSGLETELADLRGRMEALARLAAKWHAMANQICQSPEASTYRATFNCCADELLAALDAVGKG